MCVCVCVCVCEREREREREKKRKREREVVFQESQKKIKEDGPQKYTFKKFHSECMRGESNKIPEKLGTFL